MKVPIKNPSPDFENFKKILKGEKNQKESILLNWN